MPLDKGCSTNAMSRNISQMMKREGKPQKQAVAISYSVLKKACGVTSGEQMTPSEIVSQGKKESVQVLFGPEILDEAAGIRWDPAWKKFHKDEPEMAGKIERDLVKAIKDSLKDARSIRVTDVEQEDEYLYFTVQADIEDWVDREAEKAAEGEGIRKRPDWDEFWWDIASDLRKDIEARFDKAAKSMDMEIGDSDFPAKDRLLLSIGIDLGHYGYKPQKRESTTVVRFGRVTRRK